MSFTNEHYESCVYGRLEESILEYMDEDMNDKLIPHIKKALCEELARRREAVAKVEAILHTLFPSEGYEAAE
jgi:hypothetical protein